MRSRPKYSWAIKQTKEKKVHAIADKIRKRSEQILKLAYLYHKNNIPVTEDFKQQQLKNYLYEVYRNGLFIAIWRGIKGYHPLISEEKWNAYTFDVFLNKESDYHVKWFKRKTGF